MDLSAPDAYLRTWHGVLNETDYEASDPANVDLACMLVNFIRPKVVVEAGTYKGHFAFAVANILRQYGEGKVYTADPTDRVTALFDLVPFLLPHLHYHQGDFLEMLKDVPDPIDFAYIDASSKENPRMRMEHMKTVYPRLNDGGLILIDDTEGDWDDAWRFRDRADIHLGQHRGLTIIQRK